MSTRLLSKPVGGKPKTFTIKGPVVGHAFGDHDDDHFMLRVHQQWPDFWEMYLFELQHHQQSTVIESICDRDGHRGKSAVVTALHAASLQVESDPDFKRIVDHMRQSVVRQIEKFKSLPTQMALLMPNYVGSKGPNERR